MRKAKDALILGGLFLALVGALVAVFIEAVFLELKKKVIK